MSAGEWILPKLMKQVRDMYALPAHDALSFYGNPLGLGVAKNEDLCLKRLEVLTGTKPEILWELLRKILDKRSLELLNRNFRLVDDNKLRWTQLLLWEWAWSEREHELRLKSNRLKIFEGTESFPQKLLDGYYHAVWRCLEATGLTLADVPPELLPLVKFNGKSHSVAHSATTAARDFLEWREKIYSIDRIRAEKMPISLKNVPPHVGLLLLPKLRKGKGDEDGLLRGGDLRQRYKKAQTSNELVDTPGGLRLDQWPAGTRASADKGPSRSMMAKLMIAVAIERWFKADNRLQELLKTAKDKSHGRHA